VTTFRPPRWLAGLVALTLAGSVAAGVTAPTSAAAETSASPQPAAADDDKDVRPAQKLTKALKGELADGARADYWVRFETPDVDSLPTATDWAARGQQVYDALRTAARRSQRDVRAVLDDRGADYTSYWVSDAILVRGGTLALAKTLAAESEVTEVRQTSSWRLKEPSTADEWDDTDAVPWGIQAVHAEEVWADGVDGHDITVASLDTGVDLTHPALHDRYRGLHEDGSIDNDYNWFDVAGVCGAAGPCDEHGHGTHTTGTMLGSAPDHRIGVAPGARWIAVNGCAGGSCTDADLLASAQWLLAPTRVDGSGADPARRPHVVNNSWSGDPGSSGNPFFDEVLEAWNAAGIFSAWAIGNSGPSCGTAAAPGGRAAAYSVGAYDRFGDIAFFSSRGAGQDGIAKPDIAAPGVDVLSAVPGGGYAPLDGTSMATPHVAGAVALLWSARPELVGDIDSTWRLLDRSAHDVDDTTCGGTAADNSTWGEGTLDAAALVASAPTTFGTLTGSVVDDEGAPLAGATITATGDFERRTESGPDGTFSMPLLPSSYTVRISAFGHLPQERSIEVTDDGGTVTLDPVTLATAPRHTVTGTLTQPVGVPVIDTRVRLGPGIEPATTDTDGTFTFTDVPEGSYTLRVDAAACGGPVAQEVEVDSDVTVDVEQEAAEGFGYDGCRRIVGGFRTGTEEHVFPTAPGAMIETELPFPIVWFGKVVRRLQVSAKGFVRFDPPPPDPRDRPIIDNQGLPDGRLTAAALPFFDDLRTDAVYTGTTTVDGEDAFVIEWRDATLNPASHPGGDSTVPADFSLTLTSGGDAIVGWGPGIGADPDLSGRSATIGFQSAPDPSGATRGVRYADGAEVAVEGRGLLLDARPTGFVHVALSDANDGLPLGRTRVVVSGEDGTRTSLTTDLNGRADVQLPLGTYTVTARAKDYAGEPQTVTLADPGQEVDLDVELTTGIAEVTAPRLRWLLGPQDRASADITVRNTGTEPMTVSFGETRRDAAVDGTVVDAVRAPSARPRTMDAADDVPEVPAMRRTRVLSSFDTRFDTSAAVAYDGSRLWVNQMYDEGLAAYSYDGALQRELTLPWDPGPLDFARDLALDTTTGALCMGVNSHGNGAVACYSREDGSEQYRLEGTWTATGPGGLAHNAADDVFYVSGGGYLVQVAGTTHPRPGKLLHTCELPINSKGLAYDPTTGTVWESGERQDYPGLRAPRYELFEQVDPTTCEILSTASVPASLGSPGGIDIDPAGRLWVAGQSSRKVALVDVDDVATTDLPWLTVPTGTTTIPAGGSRTFTVQVDGARAPSGVLAGNVAVLTSTGRAATHLVPLTVNRSAYRVGVDVGGKAHRDRSGFAWSRDRAFRAGRWGFRGKTKVVRTGRAIAGTQDDRLFRTARVARKKAFTYVFPGVPRGTYTVELGFAEIAGARKGRRVFDVRVDGRTVLRRVDPARAGERHARTRTIRVTHRKGPLKIKFLLPRKNGKPMVSTIRVTERPDL